MSTLSNSSSEDLSSVDKNPFRGRFARAFFSSCMGCPETMSPMRPTVTSNGIPCRVTENPTSTHGRIKALHVFRIKLSPLFGCQNEALQSFESSPKNTPLFEFEMHPSSHIGGISALNGAL
ncbi:hypothetical protein CDAR_94891 [Caerostris darwini]|uniref:Uncharacterized protein n=1 Tax=Caerostris darwini TaxID=1538125 RepID=A0AAV4PI56_9ARAC|nr:hypothetical protein CDAR_94891 [Caerostris darwini]